MRSKGQKIHQSTLDKILKKDRNGNEPTAVDNNTTVPRIVMSRADSVGGDEQDHYELDRNRLQVRILILADLSTETTRLSNAEN